MFLALEYIPSGNPKPDFWNSFAEKLAQLHCITQPHFGYPVNNYIGALPQYNTPTPDAASFYIEQRLGPQFELAANKGYRFTGIDALYHYCRQHIPDEPPALVHGDLWSGNFLIDISGEAVLIDPAVAFASREMDIAMMHLFGGFSPQVFAHYNHVFPLASGWKERIRLWQLYYVLVHVNLFGRSYFAQAQSIISHYT